MEKLVNILEHDVCVSHWQMFCVLINFLCLRLNIDYILPMEYYFIFNVNNSCISLDVYYIEEIYSFDRICVVCALPSNVL